MTAGILAILQGTLTLSLSVTGYYATLTCFFPVAVLTLRFFIPTKEPLRKRENNNNSNARDFEVYVCDNSVHNPNKSLLVHDFNGNGNGNGSGSVYREEILFVREYFPLLSLQLLNSSLAYG